MQHRHFIIHKPFGYISQFIGQGNGKKQLLGDLHPFPEGTMAIGRLDKKSEGLLLLTTDGQVSEYIRSRAVEKEYHVQVDGLISEAALEKLRTGVEINVEGTYYQTLPCQANLLVQTPAFPERSKKIRDERHGPSAWISIVLKEGKFKQVRKMTAAVGFPTLRLVRVRIGQLELEDLEAGQVVEVEELMV